jgi:UrcA family protein
MIASSFIMLGCAASVTTALAAEPGDLLTKTVAYGDLNLDTPQGAKALYGRLRVAASTVCSPLEGRALSNQASWRTCYNRAIAAAVLQVGNVRVTALYDATANTKRAG